MPSKCRPGNDADVNVFLKKVLLRSLFPPPFCENTEVYAIGLEGLIEFSNHLQLWIGASHQDLQWEIEHPDEESGLPVIPPPADDFELEKALIRQASIEYSAGLQYLFRTKGKWKPLLDAGFAAVSIRSKKVEYTFEKDETELIVKKEYNENELLGNFLIFCSANCKTLRSKLSADL